VEQLDFWHRVNKKKTLGSSKGNGYKGIDTNKWVDRKKLKLYLWLSVQLEREG
jgi:hypothetical protein